MNKKVYIGFYSKKEGCYPLFISNKLPKKAQQWSDSDGEYYQRILRAHQLKKKVLKMSFGQGLELRKALISEINTLKGNFKNLPEESDCKNNMALHALDILGNFSNLK